MLIMDTFESAENVIEELKSCKILLPNDNHLPQIFSL